MITLKRWKDKWFIHTLLKVLTFWYTFNSVRKSQTIIKVEKSACNTGNCCQACSSGSTRDILTAAETEEDIKKQIGIVFDKLLEQVRLSDQTIVNRMSIGLYTSQKHYKLTVNPLDLDWLSWIIYPEFCQPFTYNKLSPWSGFINHASHITTKSNLLKLLSKTRYMRKKPLKT